jgi:hypothetical protein
MVDTAQIIQEILEGGIIMEKTVRKCTPTSAALYVPRDLEGKKFRVILIPIGQTGKINRRMDELEETSRFHTRLFEKLTGRQFRTLLESNREELVEIKEELKLERTGIVPPKKLEIPEDLSTIKIDTGEKKDEPRI